MEFIAGSLLLWMLFIVLMIVWIILPFAVFGINKRLDKANRKLDELIKLADKEPASGPASGGVTESGERNTKINQDF
jgi:F0F1-type ATP synthase membrane subunit b/b'